MVGEVTQSAFANLQTKQRRKYGVNGIGIGLVLRLGFKVKARVSFKVSLFALYFIHLYAVDGATGVATLGTRTTANHLSTAKVNGIKLTGLVKVKAEYSRVDVCHLKSWFFTKEHAEAFNPMLRHNRTPFIQHFQPFPSRRTHAIFPETIPETTEM